MGNVMGDDHRPREGEQRVEATVGQAAGMLELAALVDPAGYVRRDVARDPARELHRSRTAPRATAGPAADVHRLVIGEGYQILPASMWPPR